MIFTMPAASPAVAPGIQACLATLGQRIRSRRRQQRISALSAAEAAGLSRVTLHRIEKGESSVTMGAYMNVIEALGLELQVSAAAGAVPVAAGEHGLPAQLALADYPQLRLLAWQRPAASTLTPEEALSLYERNWRHVDSAAMTADEAALVRALADTLGGGRLLV